MKIINNRNDLLNIFEKNLIVAEIGIFKGEFSKIILEKMKPKELHLIDIFEGKMCSGDKDGNNVVWTNLNDEFLKLKNEYQNNSVVHLHKGYSFNILNNFPDRYFDLIYIDGDHSYEAVKKDLELCKIKTKQGGIIAGHDYNKEKFCGVVDAVNEFCLVNNYYIEYMTEDECPTYGIFNNK